MASKKIFNSLLAISALCGLVIGVVLFSKTAPPKPIERPNFLLVITDDQSWVHTSFAGYPAVKTPNFDRIASEGIYFRNAYASAPTCTASRSGHSYRTTLLATRYCGTTVGRISSITDNLPVYS
ncbi:MAG: sulfatase-like hydrolase/transferase [Cellvibrionales bacterium]|nr:sulfatase-like hydrolase/transferase [Cellvibrionales bacterium]